MKVTSIYFFKRAAFLGHTPLGGKNESWEQHSSWIIRIRNVPWNHCTLRSSKVMIIVSICFTCYASSPACCVLLCSVWIFSAFRRSSQVDEDTAVPRDKQLRLRECECPQALMVPWILAPNLGRWTWNIWNERKNLWKLWQNKSKRTKKWHVGMGVLCLCYCSYIMLYLKNNASWFRVFHMDPVVVTSGCVRLRVLFSPPARWGC